MDKGPLGDNVMQLLVPAQWFAGSQQTFEQTRLLLEEVLLVSQDDGVCGRWWLQMGLASGIYRRESRGGQCDGAGANENLLLQSRLSKATALAKIGLEFQVGGSWERREDWIVSRIGTRKEQVNPE